MLPAPPPEFVLADHRRGRLTLPRPDRAATAAGGGLHAHLSVGPVTAMQVRLGAALLAVPLVVRHVATRTHRLRRTDLSRRNAMRLGTLSVAAAGGYALLERAAAVAAPPGGSRRFTGSFAAAGSGRPGAMPVTRWLTDEVPAIDPDSWRLRVRAPTASGPGPTTTCSLTRTTCGPPWTVRAAGTPNSGGPVSG